MKKDCEKCKWFRKEKDEWVDDFLAPHIDWYRFCKFGEKEHEISREYSCSYFEEKHCCNASEKKHRSNCESCHWSLIESERRDITKCGFKPKKKEVDKNYLCSHFKKREVINEN